MKDQTTFNAEITDTFGGEANYGWVRRAKFKAPSDASNALIVRRAKQVLEVSGKHVTHDHGEMLELRFPGACVVMFITAEY